MRVVMMVMCLLVVGCVSEETKQLAQGIHRYQLEHSERVIAMVNLIHNVGSITKVVRDEIVGGQRALNVSIGTLVDILGEPEEPVEVRSW